MLDTLSASLAESVLQAEFRRALKDEQRAARVSRQTVTYDHLRLMNVANATRYDLGPTRYKGPIPETREISEEIVTLKFQKINGKIDL
jgi:hypothetical protein